MLMPMLHFYFPICDSHTQAGARLRLITDACLSPSR